MAKKILFSLLLYCFAAFWQQVVCEEDLTGLCELFKDGTNIRYPGSCSDYISCSVSPAVYTCPSSTTYNQNAQHCVDFEPAVNENYCRNRCEGLNGKWVADPSNCHGYYYCDKGVSRQGYCPANHHFDEKQQMCVYESSSSCVGVSSICELVPVGTNFRDENDCRKYWTCTNDGKPQAKSCNNNKYFDVELNSCADKTLVACTAHPLVSCQTGSRNPIPWTGYKADGASCRGYFHCRDFGIMPDLEPVWYQCPEGKFFSADVATTPCVDPIDAVCKYNRCDTRGTMLVQSSNNDCHNYIECVNDMPVAEHKCTGDMFFDELLQVCRQMPVYYKACDGQE